MKATIEGKNLKNLGTMRPNQRVWRGLKATIKGKNDNTLKVVLHYFVRLKATVEGKTLTVSNSSSQIGFKGNYRGQKPMKKLLK